MGGFIWGIVILCLGPGGFFFPTFRGGAFFFFVVLLPGQGEGFMIGLGGGGAGGVPFFNQKGFWGFYPWVLCWGRAVIYVGD